MEAARVEEVEKRKMFDQVRAADIVGEDVPGGKHDREENNQNDVHRVLFQLLQPDGMRC